MMLFEGKLSETLIGYIRKLISTWCINWIDPLEETRGAPNGDTLGLVPAVIAPGAPYRSPKVLPWNLHDMRLYVWTTCGLQRRLQKSTTANEFSYHTNKRTAAK